MTILQSGSGRILAGCEAVLFDKDGTIVDVHHYWASMIRLRATLLAERFLGGNDVSALAEPLVEAMGVDGATGRMKPDGPVGVQPRPVIVAIAGEALRQAGAAVGDAEVEQTFLEVDRLTEHDIAPLIRVLPGVVDFLRVLRSAGVLTAIVTTDLSTRARTSLQAVDLLDSFDHVVGGDQVLRTKPAADLALAAVDELGVDVAKAVAVGDHPVDIGMAVAAGCGAAVGVLTGLADQHVFHGECCFVVPDLTHLSVT